MSFAMVGMSSLEIGAVPHPLQVGQVTTGCFDMPVNYAVK